MSRRALSIDQKIEKAEALVASAKAKYDKALDDLKMLIDKRKEMESKKIIEHIMRVTKRLMKSLFHTI